MKIAFLKTVSYNPSPWIFLNRKDFGSFLLSKSELYLTVEVIRRKGVEGEKS